MLKCLVFLFFFFVNLSSTSVQIQILLDDRWCNVGISNKMTLFEISAEVAKTFLPSHDFDKIVFVFHQNELDMVVSRSRKPILIVDLLSNDLRGLIDNEIRHLFDKAVFDLTSDEVSFEAENYYFKVLCFLKTLKVCLSFSKQKKISLKNWFYKLCG